MHRKPAILLILLGLLLSIGGVAFYRHLDQLMPEFSEVDTFLRTSAATGDWQLDAHLTKNYGGLKPGWWRHLGIRRHANYERDDYRFLNTLTTETVVITVWRENGKFVRIHFNGSALDADAFKDVTLRKFPLLNDPRYKP